MVLYLVMSPVQIKYFMYLNVLDILLSYQLLDILGQCYKKPYVVLCSDTEVMKLYFPDLLHESEV